MAAMCKDLGGEAKVHSKVGQGSNISLKMKDNSHQIFSDHVVFDIHSEIEQTLNNFFPHLADQRLSLNLDRNGEEDISIVFGNRLLLSNVIKESITAYSSILKDEFSLDIKCQKFKGHRKVDSGYFYRISISSKDFISQETISQHQIHDILLMLKKTNGNLTITSQRTFEINIPSNIPATFTKSSFNILIMRDGTEDLAMDIGNIFREKFMGINYKTFSPEEISAFDSSGGYKLCVFDESYFLKNIEKFRNQGSLHNAICFTHDPHLLDNSVIEFFGRELMIWDLPISKDTVKHILEMILLNAFALQRERRAGNELQRAI